MYRLDRLCFEPPFRFDLRAMRRYASAAEAIVPIAEAGDELAGFAIVNVQRRDVLPMGYLTTLDVHPAFRRQRLARELMRRAEEQTLAAGVPEIRLHVFTGNAAAVALYEKLGYECIFRYPAFYGEELDAWVYGKRLSPRSR
jgi:ribosomal-protein-alanine N-acetyltransferase